MVRIAGPTVVQVLAIVAGVLVWSMIAHKGYVDISALAERHSGTDFWLQLARYFVRNLAGGGPGGGG